MAYFEDRTYENLLKECLEFGEELGVDTREGEVFYDAVSPMCYKLAKYYADLRDSYDLLFIATANGQFLDLRGEEFNVYRNRATPALYELIYQGTAPPVGSRFFTDGLFFVVGLSDEGALQLEAETPGTAGNSILPGTPAIPERTGNGLKSASFGQLIEPGSDVEGDDSYRRRIREKISGPAQNGNRQHYKTWCESVDGVSRARIIPLFAGENTVMAVLLGTDGKPAADTLVERVQEYVDPITRNLTAQYKGRTVTMGDGVGDGIANIGAHFAAVPARAVTVNASFTVNLRGAATAEQVEAEAREGFEAILKELALDTPENEDMIVRMSAFGNALFNLNSITDYSNLMLNGAAANIDIDRDEVAVLGEVTVHVE